MKTLKNYEAPEVELVILSIEDSFLGLSGGSGTASGENMTVTDDEEW